MGWNRPKVHAASKPKSNVTRMVSVTVALCVFGLSGIVLYLSINHDTAESDAVVFREKQIAEVSPVPLSKREPLVHEQRNEDPNARPTRVGEVVNGYVMLPSGRIHKRQGIITNTLSRLSKPPYHIFDRHCNNEIATYLSINPGDTLIGTRRYTGKFKQQFLDSIKDVILVTADDTAEQAQLKRDVIAARQQLKDALDRGEDIEQIMIDTRKELQDLMRVKNTVRNLFNKEVRKCETEQDVEDMIAACNQMLAEKGIAPLKCNPITRLSILREMRDDNKDF